MTEETLTLFGEALKEKDFSTFYEDIAAIWQKQTTPEKLMESFKSMAGSEFPRPGNFEGVEADV